MIGNIVRPAGLAAAFSTVAAGAFALQPPDPNNADSILAWAERTKISAVTTDPAANWQPVGAGDDAMVMAGVTQTKDSSGVAKVGVRMEHFAPMDLGGGVTALSRAMIFDVNCAANTLRMTSIAVYREHNLGASLVREEVSDPAEPITGHPAAEAAREACNPPTAIAAGPASVDHTNQRAVNDWMQSNVVLGNYSMVGILPSGVLMQTQNVRDSTSRASVRIVVRLERFDPLNAPDGTQVRSELIEYELNCIRSQARRVETASFANNNLLGQVKREPVREDFAPVSQHPMLASVSQEICDNPRILFRLQP